LLTDTFVVLVAVIAGGVSAVTGFGIGSLLTPVLALNVDARVAVAAVSIPHFVGTAVRFWLLRGRIDRRVLWTFGLTSAAGGLAGAALYSIATNRWLNAVFGVLLLFAAAARSPGWRDGCDSEAGSPGLRARFRGCWAVWSEIREASARRRCSALSWRKSGSSEPATAIALFVDGARLPVYLANQHRDSCALVVDRAGHPGSGRRNTGREPAAERAAEEWFRRVLALILAVLGVVMLTRAFSP
jgi:hypothetical protein